VLGEGGTWRPDAGDEASEPALKGWNDTEVRRGYDGCASVVLKEDFEPCVVRWLGGIFCAGVVEGGEVEPTSLTARRADIGLVPGAWPT
jgi:hypothetical protein